MGAHSTRRNSTRPHLFPTEIGSWAALAYWAIKEEILNNRLRTGETVPMERIVRELRLNHASVQEAILQFAKESLIDVRPCDGTFVSQRERLEILDALNRRDDGCAERPVHQHHQHAVR